MNDIINSLLFLSEVSMRDRPVETLDMEGIVAKARKRLSYMVKEYHGRIIPPNTWPEALGNAPWIEDVWANYISNAMKYGGEAPRVELGASLQPDGMVRFWTRDYGYRMESVPGKLPAASKASGRLMQDYTPSLQRAQ
jgi:two-component system sensor histidine kinase/response regulator